MQSVCEFSKSPLAVAGFFSLPFAFLRQNIGGKKRNPAFCKSAKNQDSFSLFLIAFFVSVREEAQDPQLEKS